MSNQDWLSLAEIARLWSDETGQSAEDLKRDLDTWFSEFVAREPSQQPASLGRNGDTTNRLMGMLGARHLERQTFEAYCEERGHPKPRFWFGGRLGESRLDEPSQLEPAEMEPEAAPPQPGEDSPSVRQASDPALAAFQTQIASMSDRLTAPGFEYSSVSKTSAAGPMDPGSEPGQAGASAVQNQHELIERAEAASAKARQLKIQLEAAERRLTDLAASAETGRAPSTARPSAPSPATPEAPRQEPTTNIPPEQQTPANYRDPSGTRQMLRQVARRKGRGRIILVAGLAVPLVALFLWGGLAVIRLASNKPIPPPTLVTASEQIQFEMAPQSLVPVTGKLGIGGEDLQQPDEPWATRSTDPTTVEWTEARQRHETATQNAATEAGPSGKMLILAAEIAKAQTAIYKQDLNAALERLVHSRSQTRTANARAAILARELVDTRLRHSAAVAIADADDESTRRQLARDAMSAADRAASLEQDLKVARQRIADLKAKSGSARTEATSLAEQLARLRKEHAALLQKFRAAYQEGR